MDKIIVQFLSNSARILVKPCNLKGLCKSTFVLPEIPNHCEKLSLMSENNPSTQNPSSDPSDCVCCSTSSAIDSQSESTSDDNKNSQNFSLKFIKNCVCCRTDQLNSNVAFQNFAHVFQQSSLNVFDLNPLLTFNCRPSICRQPLLCRNVVEVPVHQERFYHKERPESYGSLPKKDTGSDIMSLRMWESVPKAKLSTKPGFIFTVMSYNVLAQDLLVQHPQLYCQHDPNALKWETRWQNIFEEIKKLNPDILCLQEVQESHIGKYYDLLKTIGYQGIYKKRTGIRIDGCAIYYKINTINLVEYTEVEYFQRPVELLNRDNVGLVAKFSPKMHPSRDFVVATTHLLYNPRRHDVRMAQIQLLLAEIDRLCFKYGDRKPYVPVIITGDLNSSPDSDLYRFISSGELKYEELAPKLVDKGSQVLVTSKLGISDSCQHVDILERRLNNVCVTQRTKSASGIVEIYKNCESKSEPLSKGTLSHHFAFRSVYDHYSSAYSEATTYQDGWVTVDYIFYSIKKDHKRSEDKIKLLKRYRLPTSEELAGISIPNKGHGSDHISLIAKFKLEF